MTIIPAVFDNFRSLKDKTLKLTFQTNELNPQELVSISGSLNAFGYLAFKPEPFTNKEQEAIESLKTDFDDGSKTPSQRLRSVLFRCYEKDSQGFDTFARYYDHNLEKLITHFKNKLD